MKRTICMIVCLLVLFAISGCKSDKNDEVFRPIEPMVDPAAQIPEEWEAIVANNLFCDAVAFGDCLLKVKSTGRDKESRNATHWVTMLDKYGKTFAQYTCTTDDAYRIAALTATEDGGFLFVLGFEDYAYGENTWASDKGFASRVIKCDSRGKVEFDAAFESVEGGALQCCIEKNGLFYFFGHRETPETKKRGIYSRTDIYMTILDQTGKVLKTRCIAGTDYDSFQAAEISEAGFALSVWSQSSDGDFAGSGSNGYPVEWVLTVDDDLTLVKKTKEAGRDFFDNRLGEKDGKPIYQSDPLFKKFDAGTPTAFVDYGERYMIVSENRTGVYEKTPPFINSIWYYTETVYSAYDNSGKLIFRKSVDSSPDYDAMIEKMA